MNVSYVQCQRREQHTIVPLFNWGARTPKVEVNSCVDGRPANWNACKGGVKKVE